MRTVKVLPISLAIILTAVLVASFGSKAGSSEASKPPSPPGTPRLDIAENGLRVSWDPVPGADHYTVFWGRKPGDYRYMADSHGTVVLIGGLETGQFYGFAVTAWNLRGESDFSREEFVVYDNDPKNAVTYLEVGQNFMQRGFLDDAYVYMTAAIRLDPDNHEAYRFRAMLNEKMSRPDRARKDHSAADRIEKKKRISKIDSDTSLSGVHLVEVRTTDPQ